MQALQSIAQPDGRAGAAIGDADNLQAIQGEHLIGENANANGGERFCVMGGVAKLIVVASRVVSAQRRVERAEWLDQFFRAVFSAIEEVAGDEDDLRLKSGGQRGNAAAEAGAVHDAQMQVAEQQPGAVRARMQAIRQAGW